MPHTNRMVAKRGYLAQVITIPPLIYPFQYNPTQVTDTRRVVWSKRDPLPTDPSKTGVSGLVYKGKRVKEGLGRAFSGAELKAFETAAPRTVTFRFLIDGREELPGEPARLRNDAGDILGDLAVLRSFVYPQFIDPVNALAAPFGDGSAGARWAKAFFNEPPAVTLVLGGTSFEGYVTELRVTETQFNGDLNPVRAEVEVTMIERVDGPTFLLDTVKRVGRAFYYTAYEDIGKTLF